MADTMNFPKTIEEFMEQYKVVDTEQVYSNGVEFVPIFRVKQWFEHLPDPKDIFYDGYAYCLMDFGKDTVLCKDCKYKVGENTEYNDAHCGIHERGNNRELTVGDYDYCSWGERKENEK